MYAYEYKHNCVCVYKPQTMLKSAFPLEVLMWDQGRRGRPSNPQYTARLFSVHPKPSARRTPEFLQLSRKQSKERAKTYKLLCTLLNVNLILSNGKALGRVLSLALRLPSCTYNHNTTNKGFPHLLSSDILSEKQEHFNYYGRGPEKCYLFRPDPYLIRP